MKQNCFRLFVAAFVAIVLGFGGFNSVKAQSGPAHFVDNCPDSIYLLPNEYFVNHQQVETYNSYDRVVTFDFNVYYDNLAYNDNFQFTGCEEWLNDVGSLIENQLTESYHANWIADAGNGFWFCQSHMLQFTNNLPVGVWANYLAGIDGYALMSDGHFESFYDYSAPYIFSIDGLRGDSNGDGQVSSADVEPLQLYCMEWWSHRDWRYNLNGINVGRSMVLFSWPTLLDGYLVNVWLNDPSDPLVIGLGIGQLMSETAYGNSSVQPAPYEVSQNGNDLTINTDGLAVAICGNLPDGTPWQASSWTNNGSANFQVPADLQNMRIEAVSLEGATAVNMPVQPTSISLGQNYPNPFNPTTTIDFNLTSASQTSLKVYDLEGRLIATLAEGPMSTGQHSINFDGNAMASGTYFYTLEANGQTETKKMILMK